MTEADPNSTVYGWLGRDAVARQAQIRPQQLAVHEIATGRSCSYEDLETEVRRCDGLLRALVRTPGARVALLARNSSHHLRLFYGCARAGAVFVPLNWRLTGAELAALVADAEPEILIFEAEFEPEAQAALAGRDQVVTLRIGPEADAFAEALARQAPAAPQPIAPLAPCMLLYSSGTTGRPKGVVVTPKTAFYAAMNFAYVHDFTAPQAQFCDVPLFHVVGALAVMHATMVSGGRLYLTNRFNPAETLRWLADRALGFSHYFCVPQIAQALADHPDFAGTDLSGLGLITGGAPMPAPLTLRLAKAGITPSNGFGMSEVGTALGMPMNPDAARRKAGSVGLPGPAIEVRLVGPDGRDAAVGEVGEIWLRGPAVTPGYWRQSAATAAAFSGDWLRTGDAARCDADGYYFVVDRWKDMYISGGENVYPAEVEAAIAAMAEVADVAVVGVPDARWGECGCAFVVRRAQAACEAEAVLAWCAARLAKYKRPTHVRFVEGLPRTASGKVQKHLLRSRFSES